MFRGFEPVATYFTAIAWTAYLLVADAAIYAIRDHSRLRDNPLSVARMALLSIPLWLIFEAYNLRLVNWVYVGLPESLPARWFGYAWAFATITPAILFTAELIESFGWWDRPSRPLRFSAAAQNGMIVAGAALLTIPLLLPRAIAPYCFGMVWLGFVLLLDPINFRLGLPSLEGDLAAGRRGRIYSLLLGRLDVRMAVGVLELLGGSEMALCLPDVPAAEDIRDAGARLPWIPAVRARMFRHVCFRVGSAALGAAVVESPAVAQRGRGQLVPGDCGRDRPCRAARHTVPGRRQPAPPDSIFLPPPSADCICCTPASPTPRLAEFRKIQAAQPDHPLGYLLEAELRWWQIYCEACEIKWNMVDAWQRPKLPADDAYLALIDKGASLAEARIAQGDSAEMRFYAGMAYALARAPVGFARRSAAPRPAPAFAPANISSAPCSSIRN